ncbi:MAG: DUF3800 domain-containing protein [Thermodesulfobacteriota bacterium]|nr:DUF3800 domain-containing protein [Thermodesulfobacteriota bacterium]
MKFCYLDESGMGSEPILVMAGIIVDAQQMHVTKEIWKDFLDTLSKAAKRRIHEFHSRDFYNGNGPWRSIDGQTRARIITAIIDWIKTRKQKITFSAIVKKTFDQLSDKDNCLSEVKTLWATTAIHSTLSLQKKHQAEPKNKGHTVLVFDNEEREEKRLVEFVFSPPAWSDVYYGRKKKEEALNQIVDVPYFVDSKRVVLIQVADLVAYVLRVHAEIEEGLSQERYKGEGEKMKMWVEQIVGSSLPRSSRYSTRDRDEVAQLFWDSAPQSLRR